MTLVLLLQAHLDLNDEKPSLRPRRDPDVDAPRVRPGGRVSAPSPSLSPRPLATRRVLLCAPATFKGQRTGAIPVPSGQKILFVDPQGWAARRRVTVGMDHLTRSPCAARPLRMRSVAYTTSLPRAASDMSTVLLAAKRHVKAYRQPTANTLAMAAGTAAVAIVTHYWHLHAVLPPVSTALTIERPSLAMPLQPAPLISAPHLIAQLARRTPVNLGLSALSIDDVQRLVMSAPLQTAHGEGFNLDVSSSNSLWAMAGARYSIDPLLLYAVALVETKSTQPDGSIAPSPWVVRINGRLHTGSRAESEHAIQLAHLMALPVQDVGIMQVYYPMHRDIEPDPIALLNPVRNIDIGASLLQKAMKETRDPILRIGYYHSHDAELARGYGQTVLSVYRELKLAMGRSPSSAVAMAHAPVDTVAAHTGG